MALTVPIDIWEVKLLSPYSSGKTQSGACCGAGYHSSKRRPTARVSWSCVGALRAAASCGAAASSVRQIPSWMDNREERAPGTPFRYILRNQKRLCGVGVAPAPSPKAATQRNARCDWTVCVFVTCGHWPPILTCDHPSAKITPCSPGRDSRENRTRDF